MNSNDSSDNKHDLPTTLIWKDDSGQYNFVGVWSNNFMDSGGDIISESAHRIYELMIDEGIIPLPQLFLWHIPMAIGKADEIAYDARGFMIALGHFFSEFNFVAEALAERGGDLGMSHASGIVIRNVNNPSIVEGYASYEISILPKTRAANALTAFDVIGDSNGD